MNAGRKNSKPNIGIHGHAKGTRLTCVYYDEAYIISAGKKKANKSKCLFFSSPQKEITQPVGRKTAEKW